MCFNYGCGAHPHQFPAPSLPCALLTCCRPPSGITTLSHSPVCVRLLLLLIYARTALCVSHTAEASPSTNGPREQRGLPPLQPFRRQQAQQRRPRRMRCRWRSRRRPWSARARPPLWGTAAARSRCRALPSSAAQRCAPLPPYCLLLLPCGTGMQLPAPAPLRANAPVSLCGGYVVARRRLCAALSRGTAAGKSPSACAAQSIIHP